MRYLAALEVWPANSRPTAAGVGGLLATVLAILGSATLVFGMAVGVQLVPEREPDE